MISNVVVYADKQRISRRVFAIRSGSPKILTFLKPEKWISHLEFQAPCAFSVTQRRWSLAFMCQPCCLLLIIKMNSRGDQRWNPHFDPLTGSLWKVKLVKSNLWRRRGKKWHRKLPRILRTHTWKHKVKSCKKEGSKRDWSSVVERQELVERDIKISGSQQPE